MKFKDIPGRIYVTGTNAGYLYSDDKKSKWYGEEKFREANGIPEDTKITVLCGSGYNGWIYGVLVNPDPEGLPRVRVSYTIFSYTRPNDGDTQVLSSSERTVEDMSSKNYNITNPECIKPYFWIYADGKVEGDWYYGDYDRETSKYNLTITEKPHYITATPAHNRVCPYPNNVCDMKGSWMFSSIDEFSDETKKIFKDAGFPEKFAYKRGKEPGCETYSNFRQLMEFLKYGCKTLKPLVKAKPESKELPAWDPKKMVMVEKLDDGFLLRADSKDCKCVVKPGDEGKYYYEREYIYMPYGEETVRVKFNNSGTISQMVYDQTEKCWGRAGNGDLHWITDKVSRAMDNGDITADDLKDAFINNPKLKYLNDFYNDNITTLWGLEQKHSWGRAGIAGFFRTVKSGGCIMETLIKLGMVRQGILSWNRETKEYTDFNNKFLNDFGYINPKATNLMDALRINKGQWKLMMEIIDEENYAKVTDKYAITKAEKQFIVLNSLESLKEAFCGYNPNRKSDGEYDPSYKYKTLSDVPLNEFSIVLHAWMDIDRHWEKCLGNFSGYYDNYSFSSLFSHWRYSDGSFQKGDIYQEPGFKSYMFCKKHGYDKQTYDDYISIRERCKSLLGERFDVSDWTDEPRDNAELVRFHDQLTILETEARAADRERHETENQRKYDERYKTLKKLDFAPEGENRVIVCPKRVMELVLEGSVLHHCVGGYTNAVAEGRNTIVFLRKAEEPDRPYATIDMDYDKSSKMWKIRQAHTAHNGPITEEDVEFLNKWADVNGVDKDTIRTTYGALCAH